MRNLACARSLRSLAHDEQGASFVELALLLPILLLFLLGTIDTSRFITAKLDLEQAAQRTTDLALSARPKSSDATYLTEEAVRASGVSSANVTARIYLECGGVREADFNKICPTGQSHARYVSVAIQSEIAPLIDWSELANGFGFTGMSQAITVTGDSVVRFQ